jgi:2-hydroxy-3-keto-5-methylthiopentenyl-1-phosphate phosphatase
LQEQLATWKRLEGFLQALRNMDDDMLRAEFESFADIDKSADNETNESQPRMSKLGLALLVDHKNKRTGEPLIHGDVEELMAHFDREKGGEIDFSEFLRFIKGSSELEMLVRSFGFERVIAATLPKGTADAPLAAFFEMSESQVVASVFKSAGVIAEILKGAIKTEKERVARENQEAGGTKFMTALRGAPLEAFFLGVGGIAGDSDPDLEKGMENEHLRMKDSFLKFCTSNNGGINTTPAIEWYVAMCMCSLPYICIYIHTCIRIYIHTYKHTYIRMHIK